MRAFAQWAVLAASLLHPLDKQQRTAAPTTPAVDLAYLEHWGHYAAATYQRFEDWSRCTACQVPDIRQAELNATWSTVFPAFSRGYIGLHKENREIVVAFRGSTHIMDALSDMQLLQSPWPLEIPGSSVHSGFLQAYLAARPRIFKSLDSLINGDAEYKGYTLCFTGHSLGGAQATLAFLDYMVHAEQRPDGGNRARLVTFGAPRVGNKWFARQVSRVVDADGADYWLALRVVHELDLVPHLPRSVYPGQYVHSDREIWARDTDGPMDLVLCEPSVDHDGRGFREDGNCSAGTNPLLWNVPDHMVYPGMRLGIPKC